MTFEQVPGYIVIRKTSKLGELTAFIGESNEKRTHVVKSTQVSKRT